MGKGSLS